MNGLMLHCGASTVTRDELFEVATPEATDTHFPVSHRTLFENVEKSLAQAGFTIHEEAHGLTKEGNSYFGLLQVANGDNPKDYGLTVGLRNAHDKSIRALLALGSRVFVCDNLSFSGEVVIGRRHTRYIERDLPGLVGLAVNKLVEQRDVQDIRFKAYKEHELTDVQAHDIVVRAMDSRIVPVTKVPGVLEEWRNSRHEEFKPRTGWSLFNAFTEVLKPKKGGGRGQLDVLPKRTMQLHGLMDLTCGVVVQSASAALAEAEEALASDADLN